MWQNFTLKTNQTLPLILIMCWHRSINFLSLLLKVKRNEGKEIQANGNINFLFCHFTLSDVPCVSNYTKFMILFRWKVLEYPSCRCFPRFALFLPISLHFWAMWEQLTVKRFSNENIYQSIMRENFFTLGLFKFLFISFNDQTHEDVNGSSIKDIRERWWKNEEH